MSDEYWHYNYNRFAYDIFYILGYIWKIKGCKMKTYKGSRTDEFRGMRKMCMAFMPSYKKWIETITKGGDNE